LRPNAPDWLVARPIAHRGLHDAASGVIENTLPAFEAAIARGFAIECDARLSADGEAFVFHDATLQRLTFESGAFDALGATQLRRARLRGSDARIPSLRETLTCVAGRLPARRRAAPARDRRRGALRRSLLARPLRADQGGA
jgi:glycerophosphoryl diester phosphodiesterase